MGVLFFGLRRPPSVIPFALPSPLIGDHGGLDVPNAADASSDVIRPLLFRPGRTAPNSTLFSRPCRSRRSLTPAVHIPPNGAENQFCSLGLNANQALPSLDAHALHLTNLVPRNAALHPPFAPLISGFLDRANLPEEVVAFSACLLGSLSSRFAASWQDALAPGDAARGVHICTRTDASRQPVPVRPDVIVLAALSLAHGWLADRARGVRHWSLRESGGMFSVQEIEATKRAILVDMNYGLFRISDEAVQRRLRDMRRPTPVAGGHVEPAVKAVKTSRSRNLSLSLAGTALWCHGVQTPEPSP